jgi:signal transduction histidine kinase
MVIILIVLITISFAAIIAFIIKRQELKKHQKDYMLIIRKYKKLAELNHKKKVLISMASHDLSTPLASIDMWAQLLKSSEDNSHAEQEKSISMIQDAAHYGQKLIRRIVELENVIPEKIFIENFDFGTLLILVAEAIKPSIKNNIQFILHIERTVFLLSDKAMTKKMCGAVLSDCISNAKDSSEVEVNLSSESEENEIIFQVRYNAIDNAKNKLSNLFSDYKQISSPEAQEITPLAIAQRIVEELSGDISSETNENGNSIVTVKFNNS